MKKKKERFDTRVDHIPLTSSPFARLKDPEREADPPTVSDVEDTSDEVTPSGPDSSGFSVARTRKGGWPLSVENRPGNKQVTIVGNVSGDKAALLSLLKQRCGAGGAVREDSVEIQGDQRQQVEAVLEETAR